MLPCRGAGTFRLPAFAGRSPPPCGNQPQWNDGAGPGGGGPEPGHGREGGQRHRRTDSGGSPAGHRALRNRPAPVALRRSHGVGREMRKGDGPRRGACRALEPREISVGLDGRPDPSGAGRPVPGRRPYRVAAPPAVAAAPAAPAHARAGIRWRRGFDRPGPGHLGLRAKDR